MTTRTDTWGMPPRQAAAMVQREELDGVGLLRSVLSWSGWLVPGALRDGNTTQIPVLRADTGDQILEAFSDRDALQAFVERTDGLLSDVEAAFAGWQLFSGSQIRSLARISVDLHSPHGFSYQGARVAELADWADVVRVEAALRDPAGVPQAPLQLLQFARWHVVLRKGVGLPEMVLAPDAFDRALGAAFSAPDAAQAFVDHATTALPGELVIDVVSGRQLFEALIRMQVQGVVFNPVTHLPARALDAAIFSRLLALGA